MSKLPSISARDLKGVMAYLITPIVDGANRRTRDAVNLNEAARVANQMVVDGVSGICLNGTLGEGPSIMPAEQTALTAAVVEAVAGRVPVFGGATSLNTRETIDRVRAARDVGAQGVMLGRPMMATMNDENIVRFYRDVAEEVPEMSIFLYDDQEAFKRPITTNVYRQLATIPQIVGCKYRTRIMVSGLLNDVFNRDLEAVGDKIKIMPAEFDWAFNHHNFGIDAIWSSAVNGGPAPAVALEAALQSGDRGLANQITRDYTWSYEGLVPPGGLEVWHADKIPFMKARFAAAGYVKPGPPLPPYTYISAERLKVAEELGRRAKTLQEKYSKSAKAGVAA
jgi:4-(2-carboxyphenyl)-2-oxobut-3-enoate aldolase